jgi:NAD(P)-dependent dehydrogenase (short-subunit alcohol dehydrogenase family)
MLAGKTILVTGAGSGIGHATCKILAKAGASIIAADLNLLAVEKTAQLVYNAGGKCWAREVDVADADSVANLFGFIQDACPRLDGAFNNAGIMGSNKPADQIEVDAWRRVLEIDLHGVFLCMRHEIQMMMGKGGGSIVNTSSVCGLVGIPAAIDYVAAKHGVVGVTRGAACDAARTGVRVNAVLPGSIKTPMVEKALAAPEFQAHYKSLVERHPIGRIGEPEEVAYLVKWLLSDEASFINGAAIPVDGGYSAR